jgi:hypothetical protein
MSSRHTRVKSTVIQTSSLQEADRKLRVKKPRKPRVVDEKSKLPEALQANQIKPGEVRNPGGQKPGQTLMSRVREMLCERSVYVDPVTGEKRKNTRFDDVADAFVRRMEAGEFQHVKEYIEREEGKVKQKIDLDVSAIKLYEDTPTDGPEAP